MANIPTTNNNPGDLKNPKTGQFDVFNSPQSGFAALQQDLQGKMTGNTSTGLKPTSTLQEFASIWAPASDKNDPVGYAQKLSKQLRVPVNTPIGSLASRVGEFAKAIANNEGWQGGTAYADTIQSPTAQTSQDTLAQKVKVKYPQYDDIPDAQLEQKILAKYPQYADLASGVSAQSQTSPQPTAQAPATQSSNQFVNPSAPEQSSSQFVQPPAPVAKSPFSVNSQLDNTDPNLGSKILGGANDLLQSVESPFVGLAAAPVQGVAKLMGQPDPFAQGTPGLGNVINPSSDVQNGIPTSSLGVEQKLGDAAQVGSYLIPGSEGVSGLAAAGGMGLLQGAGSAMSQGKDLPTVATQGVFGAGLGMAGYGAAKLGGTILSSIGDTVSGKSTEDALAGVKDAYGKALNLNASQRAFETRTGKDLAQVLIENDAPLGQYANGTLDASKALEIIQGKQAPLDAEAAAILSNSGKDATVNLFDAANDAKSNFANGSSRLQLDKTDFNAQVDKYIGAEVQGRTNTIAQDTYSMPFEDLTPQQQSKVYYDAVNPSALEADKIKTAAWNAVGKGFDRDTQLSENATYQLGHSLKTGIEDAVPDAQLAQINLERGNLIDAQRRLTKLDGVQGVRGGRLGNYFGNLIGTIIGAVSGNPVFALGGDYMGGQAAQFLNDPATRIAIANARLGASQAAPGLLGSAAQPIGNAISKTGSVLNKGGRVAGFLSSLIAK